MVRIEELSAEKRALLASELRARGDLAPILAGEPIAIVGMGCRFPGEVDDPDALWALLERGGDAVTEIPAERWDAALLYHPDRTAPGRMNSRWGGFLRGVDAFDPTFFGIAPKEAVRMDPQQRLLLEIAWEAFEAAGIAADRMRGSATGVFVGVCANDYAWLQFRDPAAIDAHTGSGSALSIVANRLSYVLDLRGPSLAVDTACSSSLVAVHLACQSLREGECDLALAGGVNLLLLPWASLAFAKAGMMAADGRCKTFDARADGYVRSEGAGLVLLKRLGDALADGDPIEAVVRGSAVNQDGRTNVLTAPSTAAQSAVLRRALERAAIPPERVGYVEAHGTGTALGDPIEIEALRAVYDRPRAGGRCAIGSIKANLGHLEGAAGIAGLMKTVLMMRRGMLAPQPHFRSLNPHIDLAGSTFHIPRAAEPWPADGRRCAAVSSFGFGGTNAHVVLEQAPPPPVERRPNDGVQILPLSAHSEEALRALAERYRLALADGRTRPASLEGLCASAARGRAKLAHRLAIVAGDLEELAARLRAFLDGEAPSAAMAWGERSLEPTTGAAFVYGGQGGQWPGMGIDLRRTSAEFGASLERTAAALAAHDFDLLAALESAPEPSPLRSTASAQPAIFALQLALTEWMRAAGVEPAAVIGHSLGEITAARVAGFLALEEACRLVVLRARAMEEARGGAMVAVELPAAELYSYLSAAAGRLAVAAENAPARTVLAGEREAIAEVVADLAARGVRHRDLGVDYAFHSPLMVAAGARLRHALTERPVRIEPGSLAMVSTVTGRSIGERELTTEHWVRNVTDPVRFRQGVGALAAAGHGELVEISPHPQLTTSLRETLIEADRQALAVATLRRGQDGERALLGTLAALFVRGFPLDWDRRYATAPRVALPLYPFRRSRYWLPAAPPQAAPGSELTPLLGRRVGSPLASVQFEAQWSRRHPAFLGEHRILGTVLAPAAAFIELVWSGLKRSWSPPDGGWSLQEVAIERPLVLPDSEEESRTVQLVLEADGAGGVRFVVWSSSGKTWTRHVTGLALARAERSTALPDLAAARSSATSSHDPDHFYRRLQGLGYQQGSALRGIRTLLVGEGCALGEVVLADDRGDLAERYELHPALLESALQVVAATRPDLDAVYLPVGFARFELYRSAPARILAFAKVGAREGDGEGNESFTAGLFLFDPDGAPVGICEGLRVRRVAAGALARQAPILLHEPVWVEAPAAPESVGPAAPGAMGNWLLLGDDPAREQTAAALRAAGATVIDAGPAAQDADDVAAPLLAGPAGAGHWRGVVLFARAGCERHPPADLAVTLSLLRASTRLDAGGGAPRLWVVTRGAHAIEGTDPDLAAASLWGLVRTAALEHAALVGGLVDLDPEVREGQGSAVLRALLAGGSALPVALRRGRVYHPRWSRGETTAPSSLGRLAQDRLHLITGGLGAIGLQLAGWLCSRGARHLLLLGRGEPSAAVERELGRLRQQGVEVDTARVDVSDLGALRSALRAVRRSIGGVIHAAGVLEDSLAFRESPERLARVWAGKAHGAWNLHQVTQGEAVELFLLCSSIASLLGSPGQGSYAAANAYLDALALHRRRLGLAALSVNWGRWEGGGMAARQAASLDQVGLSPMSPERAIAALERALASGLAQVVIADADWSKLARRYAESSGRSMWRELGLESDAPPIGSGLATARADAPPLLLGEQTPAARERALEEHLLREIRHVLGLPAATSIPPTRGLFDLGMDSAMAVELNQRLQVSLGRPWPTHTVFEHSNVKALTRHLLGELFGSESAAPHSSGETGSEDLLSEVEALSEHEAEAMLDELTEADGRSAFS
jgi:acyl transferase domain-containing protein